MTIDNLGEFAFDIEDDVLEQMEKAQKEDYPEEEIKESEEESEEEEVISEEEEKEEKEEEEELLDDDAIYEKYGENVSPQIVRHYEEIKDYLLVNEDYEFKGDNLNEAYEQDQKNRNLAIAQSLFNSLPPVLQKIVGTALKDPEGITAETYNKLLESGKEVFDDTYDEEDEESVKNYIKKNLLQDGRDEDEVKDLIELWEDRGKLKKEAELISSKRQKEREKREQELINADRENQKQREIQQKEFLNKIDSTLKSTKMIEKRQNVIKSYIFDKVEGTEDSPIVHTLKAIYKDPEALIQLADMLSYYDVDNKKWDMSKFEKQAVTQQIKKAKRTIEEKLAGSNAFDTKGSSTKRGVDFNWDEADV